MKLLTIEVAYATPERQQLLELKLAVGTTVGDVLSMRQLAVEFPELDAETAAVGVWGKQCDRSRVLVDGDRIEFYRPLAIEPREARRQLAEAGQTMRGESEV